MIIAITGGAGFIGSRLARSLRAEGTAVRIIDTAPWTDDGPAIDIRDAAALNAALAGCSEIFHLAAEQRDYVSPARLYYDVNVDGTAKLVAAAEQHGVQIIGFTSTVAVYGLDQGEAVETSRPSHSTTTAGASCRRKRSFRAGPPATQAGGLSCCG